MNGYRRGAYADMTKDMDQGEKQSKAMAGVSSSDWLAKILVCVSVIMLWGFEYI